MPAAMFARAGTENTFYGKPECNEDEASQWDVDGGCTIPEE